MVQEALAVLRREGVQALLLSCGAQGGDGEGLGLAAGEEARTVGAGQDAHLAGDGADLGQAAPVGADAVPEDAGPDLALDLLVEGGQQQFRLVGLPEALQKLLPALSDGALALVLLEGGDDLVYPVLGEAGHRLPQLGPGLVRCEGLLGLPVLGDDLLLEADDFLVGLMGEANGFQGHILRHPLGAGLHHHDGVAGARHHQV